METDACGVGKKDLVLMECQTHRVVLEMHEMVDGLKHTLNFDSYNTTCKLWF